MKQIKALGSGCADGTATLKLIEKVAQVRRVADRRKAESRRCSERTDRVAASDARPSSIDRP